MLDGSGPLRQHVAPGEGVQRLVDVQNPAGLKPRLPPEINKSVKPKVLDTILVLDLVLDLALELCGGHRHLRCSSSAWSRLLRMDLLRGPGPGGRGRGHRVYLCFSSANA